MNTRFLAIASFLLTAAVSQAAIATWGSATNVTADSDISTLGTFVSASAMGASASYTINGVTFAAAGTPAGWTGTTGGLNGSATLSGIGANYSAALNTCAYTGGFVSSNLTLTGLTVGNVYQFQTWFSDLRDANIGRMQWDSGASTASVIITSNNSGGTPYAQYAVGTFTADSTTQVMRITGLSAPGDAGPILNMYQVRDITAVPEPSTYGLLGAGALAAVVAVRRRRRA